MGGSVAGVSVVEVVTVGNSVGGRVPGLLGVCVGTTTGTLIIYGTGTYLIRILLGRI